MTDDNFTTRQSRFYFLAFWGILGLGLLLLTTYLLPRVSLAVVMLLALVWAIPVTGVQTYFLVIRKTRLSQTLTSDGLLAKFLGMRFWTCFIVLAVSVFTVFVVLLQLSGFTYFEWIFIALTALVFALIYIFGKKIWRRESKEWLIIARAVFWATWLTPIIMVLVYGLGVKFFGGLPVYADLDAARAAQAMPLIHSSSALIREIAGCSVLLAGYRDYALGRLSSVNSWAGLLLCALGYFTIFLHFTSWLGALLLPLKEYRRLFLPLDVNVERHQISPLTVGSYVAVLIMFILIYLHAMAWFEQQAMRPTADGSPTISSVRQAAQEQVDRLVISIEGVPYDIKILDEIEKLRLAAGKTSEEGKKEIKAEIKRIFAGYRGNVDAYLNWYYSLGGEYGRLAKLVQGEIETYMQGKLTEIIAEKINTDGLRSITERYQGDIENITQGIAELKQRYKVDENIAGLKIAQTLTAADLLKPFNEHSKPFMKLTTRLGISAGAGGVGAIGGFIVTRIAAKSVSKLAAKALLKVAVGKAGGVLATTAVGAAVGSVLPGAGTAVGAGGGLVVGVVGSLVFDKGALLLEKAISRNEYKAEIISVIDEQEREWLALLGDEADDEPTNRLLEQLMREVGEFPDAAR
ncbi:MAG: hypothetical protein LBP75_01595 [Planctomycetota bacterium]|nr:hypothetical protein [Planctomycetota bacterium]